MSTGTGIEWTDATWNPVTGCTRVSEGCDHCYAVVMTHRLEKMGQQKYVGLTVLNPKGDRHFNGVVRCHEDALKIPLSWKKPRRVFVNSMADLFHEKVPDAFIRKVFAAMSYCGQHTFQVLTKRPKRMAEWFADESNDLSACQAEWVVADIDDRTPTGKRRVGRRGSEGAINGTRRGVGDGNYWPLPNVWLGTSVENQAAADERIPHLLKCPAAVRFLSCEPLLGEIDFWKSVKNVWNREMAARAMRLDKNQYGVDWVIVGGESGRGARTTGLGWVRDLVAQCRDAGVPVFVKQLGARVASGGSIPDRLRDPKGGDWSEWPEDLRVREMPGQGVKV